MSSADSKQDTRAASVPLCSIGLPVYNAERHLHQAFDTLLEQTFTDYEIIVSDNCSTDSTLAICERYAEQDDRIKIFVQERNIGASRNWNFVFEKSRGPYFKWVSANDYIAKDLLERCIAELENDDSVVLAYGHTMMLGDQPGEQEKYTLDIELMQEDPVSRFFDICWKLHYNNPQLGVIRREALLKTRMDRVYRSGDLVLMGELALLGKYRLLDEILMWQRMGSDFCSSHQDESYIVEFLDPGSDSSSNRLYLWKRMADEYWAILRSDLGLVDKLRACGLQTRRTWWLRDHLIQNLSTLRTRSA